MFIRIPYLLVLLVAIAAQAGHCSEEEDEMSEYNDYYTKVVLSLPFDEAKAKTVDAFKAQGFGLLTEIDMQAKLREKLGKDIPSYAILGMCAPDLAYRAWERDPRVGVLLPCTVVLRELEGGGSEVLIGDVDSMTQFSPGVEEVLEDVQAKINAVLEALQQ